MAPFLIRAPARVKYMAYKAEDGLWCIKASDGRYGEMTIPDESYVTMAAAQVRARRLNEAARRERAPHMR